MKQMACHSSVEPSKGELIDCDLLCFPHHVPCPHTYCCLSRLLCWPMQTYATYSFCVKAVNNAGNVGACSVFTSGVRPWPPDVSVSWRVVGGSAGGAVVLALVMYWCADGVGFYAVYLGLTP